MQKFIHFESIDSTNTFLKKSYTAFPDFQVVTANHQTKGRGRLGNIWFDDGKSALFSILIKRYHEPSFCTMIPLIAVISLHKVLSSHMKNLMIKWPNDLMVNDKKLAGILTESIVVDGRVLAVIVGFGVNLDPIESLKHTDYLTTSLYEETGIHFQASQIIKDVVEVFDQDLHIFENHIFDALSYYKKHLSLIGEWITFLQEGVSYEGRVLDVTLEGSLLVETSQILMTLSSGEVHLIRRKSS